MAQDTSIFTLHLEFEKGGKRVTDVTKKIKFLIYIGKQKINLATQKDGFKLPDFEGKKEVTVCFIYKRHPYFFQNVEVEMFKGRYWEFEIVDKRPPGIMREYHLNLSPLSIKVTEKRRFICKHRETKTIVN